MRPLLIFLSTILLGLAVYGQSQKERTFSQEDGITFINRDRLIYDIGFPQKARDKGIHGAVILRVKIDSSGGYAGHEIIESPHPFLLEAVEKKLDRVRFSKVALDGKFIPYQVEIPFNFSIPPGTPAPSLYLSRHYLKEGKSRRAVKNYSLLIRVFGGNLPAHVELAHHYFQRGKKKKAIRQLRQAILSKQKLIGMYKGQLYIKQARATIDRLKKENPESGLWEVREMERLEKFLYL